MNGFDNQGLFFVLLFFLLGCTNTPPEPVDATVEEVRNKTLKPTLDTTVVDSNQLRLAHKYADRNPFLASGYNKIVAYNFRACLRIKFFKIRDLGENELI